MTRRGLAWLALLALAALAVGAHGQLGALPLSLPVATEPGPPLPVGAPYVRERPRHSAGRRLTHTAPRRPRSAAPLLTSSEAPDALSITGPPSVTPAFVDATLRRMASPLAGLGHYICRDGWRWGVDPIFLLAFALYFDRANPLPAAAHNVGHLRATGNEPAMGGYRVFASWPAGIDAWYRLLRRLYIQQWNRRTLDAIVPLYAPSTRLGVETELNDLRAMVVAWRAMAPS